MKELLQTYRNRLFLLFRTHTLLKLAGLVVILYLLGLGIQWIPTLWITYAAPPKVGQEELSASLGEIAKDAGETLVAETETKKLMLDPATLNLKVEDKATKAIWNSIHPNGSEEEKSLIKITYMGEDNTFKYWDSYSFAVENQTYSLERITDGVRINLDMKEMDSTRIDEYVPQKITIEKYEATFVKGLEDKKAEGVLTDEELEKYRTALSLTYAKDEASNCYYNKYASAPPLSVVNQLIQVTKILNYTTDQLMADNADFGIAVKIEQPANFMIPIEVVLEGDDFLVRVPTNQIRNGNEYYTLTNIDVLPYFGSVAPEEVAEGYILVPDGAGALLELNQFDSNYGSYRRALYNNTYFNDYYYMNSYPETLHMPVFGMTYGKGEASTGGFMGIIEQGDETAFIAATLASTEKDGGGSTYNKVHTSLDVTQYAQVSILGPYDSSGGRFMASTGAMDINYRIRYKLFSNTVTYYDMAKSYRDYLINQYNLAVQYENKAKLYLDVVGALTLEERILGLPYNKVLSMTTYQELQDILTDLTGIPLVVNYKGMFNEGLKSKVMNQADLTNANGSKKQLEELMVYAEENQQELYFQTDFSKVYEKGNGFQERTHGIHDLSGYPVTVYGYDYATGVLSGYIQPYNIINPVYLSSVVDGFLKKAGKYNNLTIGDLTTEFYANYEDDSIVTPIQAQAIINKILAKIAETKTLALNNPDMNKIRYGTYATNISRESSGYGGITVEIPFRQLVMNGLINYTTLDVNETGTSEDYFLLQALELGSYPKFSITSKNLDQLKNSTYTDFISREYSKIGEDIKELYHRYEEAFEQINSMEISNHTILAEKVFETTYASGVRVITNYNKYPVLVGEQEIGALGYNIIQ